MTTIVPDVKTKYDYEDLQQKIKGYSKTVKLKQKAKKDVDKLTVTILSILVVISVFIGLWSHQIFVIPKLECPSSLKTFLPYVLYAIAFILFIFIILNVTECGQNLIIKFIQFANRWGLRLLMLFLDLLYIPVITNLVTVITPDHFTCGKGYYLQYSRHRPVGDDSIWFPFVNHSWDCLPCYPALVSTRIECMNACSGNKEWRILGTLNLRFVDDVLIVSGGIILFCVVAFLIGIPVLWRIIIRRNRSAIKRANVYGETFEKKWESILDQLNTTGIFLFFYYKINCCNWSLILIFVKLLVMIITTIAGRVNSNVYWALPVLYLLHVMMIIYARPDISILNGFLNFILYVLNFGFSIVPLLPIFGYTLPQNIIMIVSIAITVIPILTTIIMIFCKKDKHPEGDPTYLSSKEIKMIKKAKKAEKGKKNKKNKNKKTNESQQNQKPDLEHIELKPNFKMYVFSDEHDDEQDDDFFGEDPEEPKSNIPQDQVKNDSKSLLSRLSDEHKMKLFIWNVIKDSKIPDIQETKMAPIEEGYFDSIKRLYHVYSNKDYKKTRKFKISKRVIYNRAKKMYEMIDIVLDGATIELLTKTLNGIMLFGAFSFGWYLGALFAQESKSTNIFCG